MTPSDSGPAYTPSPLMHEQYDAMMMSLSAIALMASHPYLYWRSQLVLINAPKSTDDDRAMYRESAARCEHRMRRLCELLDEAMQYIGDCNNNEDAVDDYGMTDAAFAAMDRALGRTAEDAAFAARAKGGVSDGK